MTVVRTKKEKGQKSVSQKEHVNLKFENCLEATQLENKLNYLEKKNCHR